MRLLLPALALLLQAPGPEVGRPPFHEYPGSAIHYPGSARTPGLTPTSCLGGGVRIDGNTFDLSGTRAAQIGLGIGNPLRGQSFVSTGGQALSSASFLLREELSVAGTIRAQIYSHTGTYGTSSLPDSLLQSSPTIDVSTIGSSYVWVEFTFSPAYQLSADYYVIVLDGDSITNDYVSVRYYWVSGGASHGGNEADYPSGGPWTADPNEDILFELCE
jgi:hypothetical protein